MYTIQRKSNKIIPILIFVLSLGFGWQKIHANNIQVSGVSLKDRNTSTGIVFAQFTLTWDHSWKDRLHRNWDAAWVFLKVYNSNERLWRHVSLTPPTGSPVQGGTACYMALPHRIGNANVPVWSEFATSQTDFGTTICSGVFIYRKEVGHGSNKIEDIRLQFNYRDYNITDEDEIKVNVYAIEMVYVPDSPYFIGDGVSPNALYAVGKNLIIKTDVVNGQIAYMGDKVSDEKGWTYKNTAIPDTFPKGYKAVYMMKYEISQHGYADFLNTLNPTQQAARSSVDPYKAKGTIALVATGYTSNPLQYRNYVRIRIPAVGATADFPAKGAVFGHSISGGVNEEQWEMENNGGNIACNFLSWDDGLAYLDWACLRPMTEMEFEKSCRGIQFLRRSMAWGEQYGQPANAYAITNPGLATEMSSNSGSCYLETGKAPWVMRVGAFAKDSTLRNESGATYYGILDMSGNLWERCVNVSTAAGRTFIPREGDGAVNETTGEAEVEDMNTGTKCWPAQDGGGFRGFQISNRTYAESTYINAKEGARTPWYGFRGCRYPPAGTKFDL